MSKIIIDIETIPNQTLKDELKPKFNESTVKLGNLKDPAKVAAKIDQAKKEFESGLTKKMSLESNYCQIISLGYIVLDLDNNVIGKGVLFDPDSDKQILEDFRPLAVGKQIIGWNVKGFDIPIIWKRNLFVNNFAIWDNYRNVINPYRDDNCMDLMHVFNNNGMGKMSVCADLLGIESKTGMDGSMIYDAYKAGEYDKIKEYNMQDCECCLEIMKRIL